MQSIEGVADIVHHGSFLDEAADFAALDRQIEQKRRHELDSHYLSKHHVEAGSSASEVIERAQRYAMSRQTAAAYRFFARVVSEQGGSSDIERLDGDWSRGIENWATDAANASFTIRGSRPSGANSDDKQRFDIV